MVSSSVVLKYACEEILFLEIANFIKAWQFFFLQSLNDSEVPYTLTTLVYAGKPQENPTDNYVVGAEETVMKLVADYKAEGNEVKGRTMYCDRFFGTTDLADG